MRPPSPPAEKDPQSTVDNLRAEGMGDAVVTWILQQLPAYPGTGKTPPPGLFACSRRSPWIAVKGELRVSIVRLYASDGHTVKLVGQIHATAPLTRTDAVKVRAYVHDPHHFGTREVARMEQWWLEVLDRYYGFGGPTLSLDGGLVAKA